MANGIFYSVNPLLKYQIQEKYFGTHYVWCSEHFDVETLERYSVSRGIAPSSNPADIYRRLAQDVARQDKDSPKINELKASMSARIVKQAAASKISREQEEEIIYRVQMAGFQDWSPLIYAIPSAALGSRLKKVPIAKRAASGEEFVIADLKRAEFDILQF